MQRTLFGGIAADQGKKPVYASPNTRYERFINALVRRSSLPRVDAVRVANDKWKTMKGAEAAVDTILVSEARKRSLESKKLNFGFSHGDARKRLDVGHLWFSFRGHQRGGDWHRSRGRIIKISGRSVSQRLSHL